MKKNVLIKGILLLLAIALLTIGFTGCGTILPPTTQNETVYRAFLVGVGDYIFGAANDLSAPSYDVDSMIDTLNKCSFGPSNTPFSNIWYVKDHSATKSTILEGIVSVFSEADNNDISYFYFSGHGDYAAEGEIYTNFYICPADILPTSYDNHISINELEVALSSIPGTKVVIIDSCYSGGFIGKGKEEMVSFNDEIINVFSQAQSKGLLTTNQYKVLTACHYYQQSLEETPQQGNPFGVFTEALCEGCSYSGNYRPADNNSDSKVSLNEAYLYVKDWVYYFGYLEQDVQVYPNNSTFTLMEY